MALSVYIAYDFVLTRNVIINEKTFEIDENGNLIEGPPKISKQLNRFQKVCVVSLGVIYSLIIGSARILENINTVNQIVMGWVLGFWLATTFAYIIRTPLFNHVKGIVTCQEDNASRR